MSDLSDVPEFAKNHISNKDGVAWFSNESASDEFTIGNPSERKVEAVLSKRIETFGNSVGSLGATLKVKGIDRLVTRVLEAQDTIKIAYIRAFYVNNH